MCMYWIVQETHQNENVLLASLWTLQVSNWKQTAHHHLFSMNQSSSPERIQDRLEKQAKYIVCDGVIHKNDLETRTNILDATLQ